MIMHTACLLLNLGLANPPRLFAHVVPIFVPVQHESFYSNVAGGMDRQGVGGMRVCRSTRDEPVYGRLELNRFLWSHQLFGGERQRLRQVTRILSHSHTIWCNT